jgi:peptidyl-tRNA hydrolase
VTERLYVVTRADLAPGAQIAQSVHAAFAFAAQHGEAARAWMAASNTVACLVAQDEAELEAIAGAAQGRGLRVAVFREPDLDDALTAVALEPSGK